MSDVLFLTTVAAFFALATLYVGGCARILGPGPEPAGDVAGEDDRDRHVAVGRDGSDVVA